jgi:hypothetical protein
MNSLRNSTVASTSGVIPTASFSFSFPFNPFIDVVVDPDAEGKAELEEDPDPFTNKPGLEPDPATALPESTFPNSENNL